MLVSTRSDDTGDKSSGNRAIIAPPGKSSVNDGIVGFRVSVTIFGHGPTLPLHAGVVHLQDEIEDPMITQFALWPALWHREVEQDKLSEVGFG